MTLQNPTTATTYPKADGVSHIRDDGATTTEKVVTYCGRYIGSSVSHLHMREVKEGKVDPFDNAITICKECLYIAGLT